MRRARTGDARRADGRSAAEPRGLIVGATLTNSSSLFSVRRMQ
jgi:hypothetical protein